MNDTATPKVTDVLLNYVLDGSGSMSRLAQATIEGVNAFLDEQKAGDGTVRVSMTVFNTEFDVRAVGLDLLELPALGTHANPYAPHGGTALYDAVGTTIKGAEAWLANHPEFTGDVVTVIQTDGEENSSVQFTLDHVNDLITAKTKEGWEFVFQGTGQAAWTEGQKFTSIPLASQFAGAADVDSYSASYATSSRAMTRKRQTGERFDASLRAEGMQDQNQQ